jgi:hypothetical protein
MTGLPPNAFMGPSVLMGGECVDFVIGPKCSRAALYTKKDVHLEIYLDKILAFFSL